MCVCGYEMSFIEDCITSLFPFCNYSDYLKNQCSPITQHKTNASVSMTTRLLIIYVISLFLRLEVRG